MAIWEEVQRLGEEERAKAEGTKKKQIEQLKGYLKNHWDGIVSSDAAVSLGAIERRVFHTWRGE